MKLIIVAALALLAVVAAAPLEEDPGKAETVEQRFEQEPDGSYQASFKTSNGIEKQENGELKQVTDEENKPHTVVVVRGEYSYTNPNGETEKVTYTADENGFHPEGPSIPKQAAAEQ